MKNFYSAYLDQKWFFLIRLPLVELSIDLVQTWKQSVRSYFIDLFNQLIILFLIIISGSEIPLAIREAMIFFLKLMASVLVIIYKQPNSLIFYFIIFAIYYYVMNLYISSSRQLTRYESITKSPIYNHFSETINGCSSIRAFKKTDEFEEILKLRINVNNRAFWCVSLGNLKLLIFNQNISFSIIQFIFIILTFFCKVLVG